MNRGALILILPLAASLYAQPGLDERAAARFAVLALDCVHQEYPNKIAHSMRSDADAGTPRHLTPAFYGCFDWHSAVHGHWLLARLARTYPAAPFAPEAHRALSRSLTAEKLRAEAAYLNTEGRQTFERPYGLAWLLQLAAELHEWDSPDARVWALELKPLERAVVARISAWLPKLQYPVRAGEHSNTAFALGLALDYAHVVGNKEFEHLVESRARDFYFNDTACPLNYEPGGEDFLSPCLAEADLMRRVLARDEFAAWLKHFLPAIRLRATRVGDVTDGKLYHLAGLNLSRAWMLEGIVQALPRKDGRRADLLRQAGELRQAGLESINAAHYEGGHWLGSFAVYLTTGRGLR
jgi:hypothetical protein